MLLLRKLVQSTAVNAVCVLPLESGLSVILASISESVHVYDVCRVDASANGTSTSSLSSSSLPDTDTAIASSHELRPRGHVFDVGCGIISLLGLANQCFVLWTRDQECLIVRYQADLASALVDTRAMDTDHVYRPSGEPSPVHYKEQHWYVVHRVRLWCPDGCAPVHPPEMGTSDSMEVVHLRFCTDHVFFLTIKWDMSCLPGIAEAAKGAAGNTTGPGNPIAATTPSVVPSLRTTRWHTGDYMRMYTGTRFHYPTQSCSVAARRPGEPTEAHQQRIEQLWESGSTFANVPDEDLIASHAVMELSKRKTATVAAAARPGDGESTSVKKADWTGVRAVTVRRETYVSNSPIMPSPAFYCNSHQGGFINVRNISGQLAVHHAPQDFSVSRSTALKDEYAGTRVGSCAVASPRRAGRCGLDWTLLAFLTSPSHTAIYHLQRARTPLGAAHYVLDGLFAGSLRVRQVLFCTHSGDASNDVWVVLDGGMVTRFSVAELRARSPEAQQVRNVHLYQWPVTLIAGLPRTFLCRQLMPADNLFHPGRGADALIDNLPKRATMSNNGGSGGGSMGVKSGLFSMYPCTRRYAVLSDCVQDVYFVDLVERRVVAALAADGPMTDVCEAPHGYVAAYARGVLRYFQPGMQLYVRGTVRLPPFGVPIYAILATRLPENTARSSSTSTVSHGHGVTPGATITQAGVYVMISTHRTSQLYRLEDGNFVACSPKVWDYKKDEPTLTFEAVTVKNNKTSNASEKEAGACAGESNNSKPESVVVVQCTSTQCRFNSTVHYLPYPAFLAAVSVVSGAGPVCIAAFREGPLTCTHLAVVTSADGVCLVDLTKESKAPLVQPTCIAVRALSSKPTTETVQSGCSMEVLVGCWDSCVTVLEVRCDNARKASHAAWRCVATQILRMPSGTASPVQQLVSLPRAGQLSRWMATHSSGEVSILALVRCCPSSCPSSKEKANGENNEDVEEVGGWTYVWAPTSPPDRRAQQKVTCFVAPVVRAPPIRHAQAGNNITNNNANKEEEEEEDTEEEVYNGFDGALLQPRDGALTFFSVPLEEGDTQAPLHMQRLRERDEEDAEWVVRLENTVRAIVPPEAAGQVRAAPWRCAALLETVTAAGTLRYDALVVQHDEVTLCTLDEHLFAPPYPRPRAQLPLQSATTATSTAQALKLSLRPPPRRAHVLAVTAPSRYVCTISLRLPQLSPYETLVSIAREPDDEGEGVLLCVTVCEQTKVTRLTTLHSGTLTVLDSLVLHGSLTHWMSAVPPSTPNIARAAPLFLLCVENVDNGVAQLQAVAAHPLRIASSETLEDSTDWVGVASRGVKVDGAVQVVPTRMNSDGDTYGGEVLVTITVDYAIHLFVLRGYTLLFQHCVLAPACATSVTLCYPVVSVCTEGDSNVYLQVYPVNDDTEVFAPSYTNETSRPLKKYGMVSWKMRVSMREPTFGACVLAQSPLYDRCVRTDMEGDVTVTFINLSSANAKAARAAAAHVKGEDCYVGSAEGPQTFLTHTVRLPSVPLKARLLRHVAPVQRRTPRQLQCNGHSYHLQSSSLRKDRSSRLLLLPCHDGSLYGAFEIPYGFAHPLLRLEQVITDTYALDLSLDLNPTAPGTLQHTYHLQPFHVARALQPLIGTRQAEKQACIMVDAIFEYFLLRDLVKHGYGVVAAAATTSAEASSLESDAAVVQRKFTALDDVVQTLLTEEYREECTVDLCAEMLYVL